MIFDWREYDERKMLNQMLSSACAFLTKEQLKGIECRPFLDLYSLYANHLLNQYSINEPVVDKSSPFLKELQRIGCDILTLPEGLQLIYKED